MARRPGPIPREPLSDGIVLLRLPRAGDVEAVYAYGQDPDVAATGWLPLPVPCPRPAAARLIREFQRGWQSRFGLSLAIAAPPAAELCGVVHLAISATAGEIAYGVAPAHRRQGLASRAVRLLSSWAFAHCGLGRLEICVTARGAPGLASRRVAEHAGFVYAGLRRSRVPATGVAYADPLYVLAREVWEAGRARP